MVAGGLNAATELGSAQALWSTAYGRVLLAKTALVCVVAALSYAHALRLRPRLLAAARGYDAALERRHWRLLATEPILGIGIVVAAALLLAYAPPIDLAEQVAAVRSGPPQSVGSRCLRGRVAAFGRRRGGTGHRQRARQPGPRPA